MPYRHILCATDFHDTARAALGTAASLARRYDAALTLVHVLAEPRIGYPGWHPEARFATAVHELAATSLADWKRDAEAQAGRAADAVLVEGVPWQRIVRTADERGCDLIVVSASGASGLAQALVGSVAERVLRHAACPVLVVR